MAEGNLKKKGDCWQSTKMNNNNLNQTMCLLKNWLTCIWLAQMNRYWNEKKRKIEKEIIKLILDSLDTTYTFLLLHTGK